MKQQAGRKPSDDLEQESSVLKGSGEVAGRIRAHDWAATPLGPMEGWPASLLNAVQLILDAASPMWLAWGDELIHLHNDALIPILGSKYQASVGQPLRELWVEAWEQIGSMLEGPLGGRAIFHENLHFVLERHGRPEDAWFTFSYTPLRDAAGDIRGVLCTVMETTETMKAEQERQASEARYCALVEASPQIVWFSRPDGSVTYINQHWLSYSGLSLEASLGFGWAQVMHPDHRDRVVEAWKRAATTDDQYEVETPYRRHDGTYRWHLARGVPLKDAQGRVQQWVGVAVDIDDRKRAELALQNSERRYRSFVEASSQVIWRVNRAGEVDEPIPAWQEFTGQSFEAARGLGWVNAIRAEQRPAVFSAWQKALAQETVYEVEYELRRHDGQWRAMLARGVPVKDAAGDVVEWIGTCIDIHDRKRAEEALHLNAERVQLALKAGAIIGTWMWDLTCDQFTIDEGFAHSFGLDPGLGREGIPLEQIIATVHPDDKPGLRDAIAEAIARGGPYSRQYRVKRQDGHYYWIEANGRVDHGPDGTPLRFPGVLLDMEGRRAIEAERDRADALLRTVIETVPGLVYAKDREGRILIANHNIVKAVGLPIEEIIGKTEKEFLKDSDQADIISANDRRILESGEAQEFEEAVTLPDGTTTIWLSNKMPMRDAAGQVVGLLGTSVDITRRKEVEDQLAVVAQKLARSEAQLSLALEGTNDGLWDWDMVTGEVFHSPRWIDMLGYMPEEWECSYENWLAHAHPEDVPGAENVMTRYLAGEIPEYVNIFRMRHKDGSWRWMMSRAKAYRDAQGTPIRMVGVHTDITAQREAESALRESEARFRDLADSIGHMVWVARADGYHEYYNRRWYEFTGAAEGETDGLQPWGKILHPDDQDRAWARWQHSLKSGEPYEIEYRLRRANGEYRWVLGRAEPIRDAGGRLIKWYGTCTDIQELYDARRKAEDANAAKSDFLANMSHEIRTPLNAIVGIASLLERGGASAEKQSQFFKTLRSSADALLALINDLLDISKIEQRDFQLADERFRLDELFGEVISMLSLRAKEKNIGLMVDYEAVRGLRYTGDKQRLRQVLLNVVGNAVKFTDTGTVSVRVLRKPDLFNCEGGIEIQVIDTGIGIPRESQDRLFEKFMRADNASGIPGTGLGLAISRHLIEMMGGTITLTSTVGFGTKVFICLPDRLTGRLSAQPRTAADMPSLAIATNKRVLLVEDFAANVMVATAILDDIGVDYDIAYNGEEALRLLKQHAYGLVLMDVNMPVKDGLAATRELRGWEAAQARPGVPVIGMTAHALAGDRDVCFEAGMNDFLPKPVTAEAMFEKIRSYLR
jgi:PAS domain S-box-containing protein